jgi:hypothetical protein
MGNRETFTTLGTQDTGQKQKHITTKKQNKKQVKIKIIKQRKLKR